MSQHNNHDKDERLQEFVMYSSHHFDDQAMYRYLKSAFPEPRIEPLDDVSQLDEYSQQFVARLLSTHPLWRPCLQRISQRTDEWAVWLELMSPSAHIRAWLSTEDEQVTVGFGGYHAHFYSYPPKLDIEAMERALKFLDEFLAERLVLVTDSTGHLAGIDQADLSDRELIDWINEYRCDRIRIESWNGTFDREFIAPPAE